MRLLLPSRLFVPRLFALLLCALTLASHAAFAQKDSGSYGPIVAIVSPEYSDVIKDETSIVIAITPRRYQAQSVELLVDGKAVSGVLAVQTKFKWNTKLFVDGPHTLGVRVTDTQGFIGQAETTVYINNNRIADSSAPILRWLGVENGQSLSGVAKIRLQAADDFGVKYVFLNLNTAIAPDLKPSLASWMTNRPPYEFALDTTRFADGLYVLDAYAFDAMENERNAPRLTVGFYNSNANPGVQPEAPAPLNAEATPEVKSDATKTAKAPSATSTPSRLAQAPQGTVTTTDNGWVSSTPAPRQVETPTHSQRITTVASAKISDPQLPVRSLPAQPAPSKVQPEVVQPEVKTQPEVKAQAEVKTAKIEEPAAPTRIAKTGSSDMAVGRTPEVTLAGQKTALNEALISVPAAGTGPTRLAAAPEVRWTTQAEFRNQAGAATRSSTGRATGAATTLSQFDTLTVPSAAASASEAAKPLHNAVRSSFQMTSPTAPTAILAALPQTSGSSLRADTVDARLTVINKGHNTRMVFSAPYSPVNELSTPTLPTVPRLALSPDFSNPTTPAPANAAIVVAPSLDAPMVHVATHNDTLSAIAARYKMPVSAVAAANGLKQDARVVKGTKVLLPQALLVSYKGQAVTGDVAPLLIGSTSVAPFRFLFEKQGGTMDWDGAAKRVTARNGDYAVSIEIGSDKALVNEKEVLMDMAAFLLSGRTMVPVRFFEKALQAKVEWEPSTGRIFVAMTP